jgi:hypothetical protein
MKKIPAMLSGSFNVETSGKKFRATLCLDGEIVFEGYASNRSLAIRRAYERAEKAKYDSPLPVRQVA